MDFKLFILGGVEDERQISLFACSEVQNKAHTKFMEEKMLKLVEILVKKGRRNIAIIGEQGSGKTTAADEIIIRNLSKELSIGLAEYTHELSISEKYPEKNVVELQYGKQFEPSSITEMFFRFNRDIVIYGEVRNPFEAFEMIKAMLRQARGSLFTFHSSSAQRMIHDLRQLLMQTGYYIFAVQVFVVWFSANNPKHSHNGIFVFCQLETHTYYVVFGNFHK